MNIGWITVTAQDTAYIKSVSGRLASDSMQGRGYTGNGMGIAAKFLQAQMDSIGLKPAGIKGFTQSYSYPVNTFPGRMQLSLNGIQLVPGTDFLATPESRAVIARGRMERLDSITWVDRERLVALTTVPKLTWSVSAKQEGYTMLQVTGFNLPPTFEYDCMVDAKLIPAFEASNVLGMVRGTRYPDSIFIVSAHYDHLGTMGDKTIFNGANDNASGTAVMLGLAAAIAKKPLPYSVLFIAFSGEEAGLLGSKYYTEHAVIPLAKTKFVLNLDLLGNGEEGITVVNATEFPQQFALLKALNDSKEFVSFIGERGKASNSDHYWFSEKGVPAFFIYTLGARKAYHDIDDVTATLPWPEVKDLPALLLLFLQSLR